jgi:hypothetical protein
VGPLGGAGQKTSKFKSVKNQASAGCPSFKVSSGAVWPVPPSTVVERNHLSLVFAPDAAVVSLQPTVWRSYSNNMEINLGKETRNILLGEDFVSYFGEAPNWDTFFGVTENLWLLCCYRPSGNGNKRKMEPSRMAVRK